MTAKLNVTLHGRQVATITNIDGDINVVSIDQDYANDPEAPVISFRAFRDPLTGRYINNIRPTKTRVHPYFGNLLPEGPLRKYLADHANVKTVRDFPLLLLLGNDLPGALILTGNGDLASIADSDPELAEIINDDDHVLRFSLAGVQLKLSAIGDPQRGLTIPVNGMGGRWIIKLPDQRFDRVPENEFAMMTFARSVGIDVPAIGLVDPTDVDGIPTDLRNLLGKAFYIKRFDRLANGTRVHTEDFAQANVIFPEGRNKYKMFNFDLLGEQVADVMGQEAALELVQRIVFNFGIGNGDMHSKNWSVIYRDGRTPSLAPAYDYLSKVVYIPNDNLGINFADTQAFAQIDEAALQRYARRISMPRKPVVDAALEMVEKMKAAWPSAREAFELPRKQIDEIEQHMNSVPLFSGKRTQFAISLANAKARVAAKTSAAGDALKID